MQVLQQDVVIQDIQNHIANQRGSYSSWYVGIASDPKERLFSEHGLDESNAWWIYRRCTSDSAARDVESYFLRMGCQGGSGGGSHETIYVYAYLITSFTRE